MKRLLILLLTGLFAQLVVSCYPEGADNIEDYDVAITNYDKAFTGQYDGNTEVFVIPSAGGIPRRLTYTATLNRDDLGDRMGPNNIVIGWTPDSKHILFRTRQFTFNDFTGQLMTVPAEGGEAVEIPLKNGGFASYSPDGKKLAYNYVFREFRTWKRYQGGMAFT